jgi:hypothetical protein
MIDGNCPVTGHEAKQLRLLGPLPAADAGAYRLGHQNRLTPRRYGSLHAAIAISRRPASADGRESATFAVSRSHTSADGTAPECAAASLRGSDG